MIQSGKSMRDWLSRYHIGIVLILSLFHVSRAALHTRDSGKADLSLLCPSNASSSTCRAVAATPSFYLSELSATHISHLPYRTLSVPRVRTWPATGFARC